MCRIETAVWFVSNSVYALLNWRVFLFKGASALRQTGLYEATAFAYDQAQSACFRYAHLYNPLRTRRCTYKKKLTVLQKLSVKEKYGSFYFATIPCAIFVTYKYCSFAAECLLNKNLDFFWFVIIPME